MNEKDMFSTDQLRLYGPFLGAEGGCQDYTAPVKLKGVRLVDEKWLAKLVKKAEEKDARKLLKAAIDAGATFPEFMEQYTRQRKRTPRDLCLIQKARVCHEREGEVEFDDVTITSGSGREAGGEYVLAWVWVED